MGFAIILAQKQACAGRAMIIAHLAHRWAHHGKKVGLVDLDSKKHLTKWANTHRLRNLNLAPSQAWYAKTNVRNSKSQHDITLIDCPNYPDHLFRSVCGECDLVLAPCKPTSLDPRAVERISQISKDEGTHCSVLIKHASVHSVNIEPTLARLKTQNTHVLQSRLSNRISFMSGFYEGNASRKKGGPRPSAWDEVEALRIELDGVLSRINGGLVTQAS